MRKYLIMVAGVAALSLAACAGYAQTLTAGAASGSNSSVDANTQASASSGSLNYFEASDAPSRTEVLNLNSTAAPSVFGGGHPCLSGESGAVWIAAYGKSKAEPICMLKLLGQDAAALILLADSDTDACKALVKAGAIKSDCGGTIKTTSATTTKKPTERPVTVASITKCEVRDGKRTVVMKKGYGAKWGAAGIKHCKGKW